MEKLELIAEPSFAPSLCHTRHIRVDFGGFWDSYNGFYLAHIWLICLQAVNLETLELGDLVLNEGDDPTGYGIAPYQAFSAARPLQFDLRCLKLVRRLPRIFERWSEDPAAPEDDALERLADQFRHIGQPRSAGGPGVGFAKLKHVCLMDGNGGISIDDYAKLFLVPRDWCKAGIAELHELTPKICSNGPDECQAVTACPMLETLTLVLWYDSLVIDGSFLHAMMHVVKRHPRMKRLNLASRRLRYEPRLLREKLTLDEWFKLKVVPLLQLAQELFAHKLELHIYILALYHDEWSMLRAIERHRADFPDIHVSCLCFADSFVPKEAFRQAAAIHREICLKDDRPGQQ